MSVGGRLIEIVPHTLTDKDNPTFRREVLRLWVVDRTGDESVVYAVPQTDLPVIGDEVWWSGGKIYFDGDRKHLVKVGYSTSAP